VAGVVGSETHCSRIETCPLSEAEISRDDDCLI